MNRWKQLAASRVTGGWLAALEMLGIFALSHRSWKGTGPSLSNGLTNLCHFPLYAMLGALLAIALGVGADRAAATRAALQGAMVACLYGVLDEWHQGLIPGRDCSLFDVTTNLIAAVCGAMALATARWGLPRRAVQWLIGGLILAVVSSYLLPDAFPEANLLLRRAFFD